MSYYDRYDGPFTNAAQEAYVANAYFHYEAYFAEVRCSGCYELLGPDHDDPESPLCSLCAAEALLERIAEGLRAHGLEVDR